MWSPNGDRKITVEGVPTITLSRDFAREMKYLVNSTPTEISWVGEVEGDAREKLTITKLHIMKQKVSAATFEEEDNAFVELKSRVGDAVYKIRCHGHSHVSMGVSPSGTDQKHTVDNWRDLEVPYLIRLIANKQGDLRCDFFDFERGVNIECCKFEIEDEPLVFPELEAAVKELVSPLPVPAAMMMGGGPVLNGVPKNGTLFGKNSKPEDDDFWFYKDDAFWWLDKEDGVGEGLSNEDYLAEKEARRKAFLWRGSW